MKERYLPPSPVLPRRLAVKRRGPGGRRFYDPSQVRDWHGRWSEGGGGAPDGKKPWEGQSNSDVRQKIAEAERRQAQRWLLRTEQK
jgi:hypothetical protein